LKFRTLNNSGYPHGREGEINKEMEIDLHYYTETKGCGVNTNIRTKAFSN